MKRDIIIAENFYADPDSVVRYAQGLAYIHPYQQPGGGAADRPITWYASRYQNARDCPFKSSSALIAALEALTGEPLDRTSWDLEFPVDAAGYPKPDYAAVTPKSAWWNCCFHAKPDIGQEAGHGVHSHTNLDAWNPVGLEGWAGIIYLNRTAPPGDGGLYTWANRRPERQHDWMTDKSNWVRRDTFGNVYNRLVLHRGRIPHSGANGWGAGLSDARFYQTFFFRTLQLAETPSLTCEQVGIRRTSSPGVGASPALRPVPS